jgi:hypothetical protein
MRSQTKQSPVNVSQKGLGISSGCQLQKNLWPLRTYSCRIPLENFQNLPGKDFRFETTADLPAGRQGSEIKAETINARFIRDMNYENFLFSAGTFFNRIKNRYGTTP